MTQVRSTGANRATSPPAGGVKETVEQILVAFILAFVFRCYIVEAFVIPTGSMAPTLLGAHMNFRCGDCGYHFSVNYNAQTETGALALPDDGFADETYPVRCANCGYRFPFQNASDPENDATAPAVQYGDRILVQKYVYLLHEPRRWDVVVFKNPDQPSAESERYQDNYIKRLIFLPNEYGMVLDGDVYTAPNTKPQDQLEPADFTVQPKTRDAQEALWRIVYDDDYRPRGLPRLYTIPRQVPDPNVPGGTQIAHEVVANEAPWRQPWAPDANAAGWNLQGQAFQFDGTSASGGLQYDVTSMAEKFPLTDWLAYDTSWQVGRGTKGDSGFRHPGYQRNSPGSPLNNVSDVKLAVSYTRLEGDGNLQLSTTKQGRTFTALVTPDEVRLEMRIDGGEPVVIGQRTMRAGVGRPARIALTNADYRVSLEIDGNEIAATTPDQFAPDVAALLEAYGRREEQPLPRIRIDAQNQRCTLEHVSLWRDVYYLNTPNRGFYWAMPANFPNGDSSGGLIRLGEDEFFVLGDNSMLSGDARIWKTAVTLPHENLAVQAGRVPRRFLLGCAFFVYWPAGFAPVSSLPAFVPNFGEMRFIH